MPGIVLLDRAIQSLGASAVISRPLSAGQVRQIFRARNIEAAYRSREQAEDAIAWERSNPIMAAILERFENG